MTIPRKVILLGAEPLDHVSWNRNPLQFDRIAGVLRGPHPGLAAFDCKLAADRDAMLHLEARAAEPAHLRGDIGQVIELGGLDEARLRVDQRDPDDAVGRPELVRSYSQGLLEQEPRAPV